MSSWIIVVAVVALCVAVLADGMRRVASFKLKCMTGDIEAVMKHAVGWPNGCRNHFIASEDHHDIDALRAAVELGFMVKKSKSWVVGDIYQVTPKGRQWLIERG